VKIKKRKTAFTLSKKGKNIFTSKIVQSDSKHQNTFITMKKKATGIHELNREIRINFANLIAHNLPKLQDDLETLTPKERLRTLIDMAKAVLPRITQTDDIDKNGIFMERWTDEDDELPNAFTIKIPDDEESYI
jgi:hypothetical protein